MNVVSIIMLGVGSLLGCGFLVLMRSANEEYAPYVEALPDAEHPFKPLYAVGFKILDAVGYQYKTRLDVQRQKECNIVFGEKYGEYYFRLNYAQKVGVASFVVPFMFLSYPLFQGPLAFLVGAGLMYLAYWNYDMKITDVMQVRNREIESALPSVISKLALLANAGMILSEAWEKVSKTGDSTIYKEMQNAVIEVRRLGRPELDSYLLFAERCSNVEVKKFISTLSQNLTKGNRELVTCLREQARQSWEEKKHRARRQGEKASSKLLIPIGIMFVGILIMVVVPIFATL